MKVCMIGGTGLLGSEGAKELIARGHQVKAIALPPLPQGAVLPPELKISYGNYLDMTDDEVRAMFAGCEGFVFAEVYPAGEFAHYDEVYSLVSNVLP